METNTIERIPLWLITPAPAQPRSEKFNADKLWELAQSITANGLIQPVVVVPVDDAEGYSLYELVAGERRARATVGLALGAAFPQHGPEEYVRRLANVGLVGMDYEEVAALKSANAGIEAIIRDPAERRALQVATVAENIARESLSPIEEARAFETLMRERQWSQRELAGQIGVSQGYVGQRMSLLTLPETVQEAVNTQVITIANARDIAGMPEYAQKVAGEFIAKWSAAGETTKVITDRVHAVKNMLDPQWWTPNPERFYEQKCRNRMRIIAAIASQATADVAKSLFATADGKNHDVLTRTAKQTGDGCYYTDQALQALGITKLSQEYLANLNGDSCANCIFNDIHPETDDYLMGYCKRWLKSSEESTWCEMHIGSDEPVLIALDYYTSGEVQEDQTIVKEGTRYVDNLETYLSAYNAALAKRSATRQKYDESAVAVAEIREYCEWVDSLSQEAKWHFQAHACTKCTNYALDNERDGLPHCRFAKEMLRSNNNRVIAPRFAMLVGKNGWVAPRCEMFRCSEENITVAKAEPYSRVLFSIGLQMVLDWMKQMYGNETTGYSNSGAICGCLNWLPYRRDRSTNWDNLFTYIHARSELLGGDRGRAVLIDSVMYEGRARREEGPWPLLNVETGEIEEWMPAPFPLTKYFCKESWPKNWFRPWEKEEEKVTEADDGDDRH